MDEIAEALSTIPGLHAYAYEPDSVTPDAAFPQLPEDIEFDGTYGRGMDRITLAVTLVTSRPSDRVTRDRVAAYAKGSGDTSVKQAIETAPYSSLHVVQVTRASFGQATIGGTQYPAINFTLSIVGSGS